jgi:hypothetical protein
MPKNEVSDPITHQEMAFALLSGNMTDERAAEAVGLNPANAAYIKSKPCVRAFMLEHRAATQQQLVELGTERLRPLNPSREQVLGRLWEFANMALKSPEAGSAADAPPDPGPTSDPGESTFADSLSLSETVSPSHAAFARDTRVPFSIPKNPFARRRPL